MKPITLTLVVLAVVLLTACGNSRSNVQELTIEATDIAYSLNQIEVVAGQPVKLTLKDNGSLDHDFSILEIPVVTTGEAETMPGHDMSTMTDMGSGPQLHVAATAGTSNTIEFTPTKPGTYEFFCTVAGHKEAGMIGTLVVKEP